MHRFENLVSLNRISCFKKNFFASFQLHVELLIKVYVMFHI